MGQISNWDWEVGEKTVVKSLSPLQNHEWQEEPYVSPDGETLAAVVNLGEMEFSIRTNDTVWDGSYERIWYPRYSPDGRLTALCQQDGESVLAIDGQPWSEPCEYVWDTKFNSNGSAIAAMSKTDSRYGVALNGKLWENLYENANQYTLSDNGRHSAAVVQVESLGQADIQGFKKGVFTLAVDGDAWANKYQNLWTPVFDTSGLRVAAQARVGVHQYTITVDDEAWSTTYPQVWAPTFHPKGSVVAPVRMAGKWGIARDGAFIWNPNYIQCVKLQFSKSGDRLWAIVAPSYGKFTLACNDKPWTSTFPVVTDMVLSPQGNRAGAIASNNNSDFRILVDDQIWNGTWDMAWPVIFSLDGRNAGALVEEKGKHLILINGKPYDRIFDRAWQPTFSEDGSKVLIRAIENNSYVRIIADVASI